MADSLTWGSAWGSVLHRERCSPLSHFFNLEVFQTQKFIFPKRRDTQLRRTRKAYVTGREMPAAFACRTIIWGGRGTVGSWEGRSRTPKSHTGPDISQGQMPLLEHDKGDCFHLCNLQGSQAPFSFCPPDRAEGLARLLLSPG